MYFYYYAKVSGSPCLLIRVGQGFQHPGKVAKRLALRILEVDDCVIRLATVDDMAEGLLFVNNIAQQFGE